MQRLRSAGWRITVLGLGLAILAWGFLIWTTGCSRQLPAPASGGAAKSSQLPFERVSDGGGISPTSGFSFDGIPAGTAIAVRLQGALSSTDSRVGQSFVALVDGPVIVGGKIVVPSGATVTGSVLATRASRSPHQPGYLRLTLTSMMVNGKAVPLQTSSIFAKGASYGKRQELAMMNPAVGGASPAAASANSANGTQPSFTPVQSDVKFSTGHRFTFRVAQPVHL